MIVQLTQLLSFSLLATCCTFLLQTVLTHCLAPADYGRFAKWLTDISFWGLFFIFGLDNSILYFSKNKHDLRKNTLRNFLFFALVLSVYFLVLFVSSLTNFYYVTLGVAIFMLAVFQTLNATYQYAENFRLYGAFNLLRAVALLVPFLVIFFLNIQVNVFYTVSIYTLISTMLVGIMLIFSLRAGGMALSIPPMSKDYFLFGLKSMANTLLAILLYTSTIYLLDYFADSTAVGIFFIAAAIAKLVWIVPDTAGNILYPKFLKIGNGCSESEAMETTYFYAQLVLLINLLAFLAFAIVGKFFISLVYSSEYSSIYLPTCILLLGNQGMVFYKILGRYFASKDKWRIARRSLILGVASNSILNPFLIPQFGVTGAAVATAISFWVCGVSIAFALQGSLVRFLSFSELIKGLSTRCAQR